MAIPQSLTPMKRPFGPVVNTTETNILDNCFGMTADSFCVKNSFIFLTQCVNAACLSILIVASEQQLFYTLARTFDECLSEVFS